ncbi:hypothetical protein EMPS_04670 [Entomortierella parvispora]|uniref:Mid2 domain-containing protein n=1 Tax=Entomortierella parvispora TaxID=205924 RepID=A0A9P3H9H5_9FUNG|nr:hypothetical protein EMPS_04670 [Entomortierella parvispora]
MRLASTSATQAGMASASTLMLLLITLSSSVHAQASGAGANTSPLATDKVQLSYWKNTNEELASEFALFNTCFVTEAADTIPFSYLTMVPKNATVNFYKDPECGGAFAYAMDGYYLGYPGSARSYRWVGWSEDAIGELQTVAFPLMPGSSTPPPTSPEPEQPPPKQEEPTQPPPATGGQEPVKEPGHGQTGANDEETSYSSTFFGGVIGTLAVLSVGGVVFWRKVGRGMMGDDDKGKDVLPYNRVAGGGNDVSRQNAMEEEIGEGDEDILLTTKDRMEHNSFALEDEDDDEDDEEDEGQGSGEGHSLEDERESNSGLLSKSGSKHLDQ